LKALREVAGFTQEELATIAGLSVHAINALERGERRRPQLETVRAPSAALDLPEAARDEFRRLARPASRISTPKGSGGAPLPLVLTSLVGREADLHTLEQWLGDDAARLITLVGPGGVGKTRLALELARLTADAARSRVAFVSLASVRDPALVASAIAEALQLSDVNAVDLPMRVRAAPQLRTRHWSPVARAIRSNPAATVTTPMARATPSPPGARRSTVIAAVTLAIARRSITPMTMRIAVSPAQE